jgi:uncharacterized membrane protein YphA (DoxX/SURF4 family)
MWYQQLLWKLPPDFGRNSPGEGLWFWMNNAAQHPTHELVRSLLVNLFIPNFYLFGWLVWLMELAIAVSLVFGLFVRAGALLATLQSLNLLVLLSAAPNEWYWTYGFMVLLSLVYAGTRAGRAIGLDQLLAPRLAREAERGNRLARLLLWLT